MKATINDYIGEWNSVHPKLRIDIVLFDDAIHLLSKVNRIIACPFGHSILVGLGGSGRHTMSRLASFMQDYSLFELDADHELNAQEWYDFMKEMLKSVAVKNKQAVFLLSDAQILDEQFLEDINNLLNIGEIPNLYLPEERENILSEVKDVAETLGLKNLNQIALWELFINLCKMNLHICLCLSPIGTKLRTRLRNFPSLVSCTSPLWILPWSDHALYDVAMHFI